MLAILIVIAQIGASQAGGTDDFEVCKGNRGGALADMIAACARVIDNKALDNASLAEANRIQAFRTDDSGRAMGYLDQAIALNPNNSDYYSDRRLKYGEKGDFDRALADHDKALSLQPDDAYVYGSRALTLFRKGDATRALADIDKAISLEPKETLFPKLKGDIHASQGDTRAAIASYDRAIEIDPNNTDAKQAKADIDRKLRDTEAEAAALNRVINVAPEGQSGLLRRALAYEQLGKLDLALKDYDALIAMAPSTRFYTERRDRLRIAMTIGGAPPAVPVVVEEGPSAKGAAPTSDSVKGSEPPDCRVFVPGANLTVVVPCAK